MCNGYMSGIRNHIVFGIGLKGGGHQEEGAGGQGMEGLEENRADGLGRGDEGGGERPGKGRDEFPFDDVRTTVFVKLCADVGKHGCRSSVMPELDDSSG